MFFLMMRHLFNQGCKRCVVVDKVKQVRERFG